jgi:hypothetical protein
MNGSGIEQEDEMEGKHKYSVPRVPREMTSTTFDLSGHRVVKTLGVVRGITVRSANLGNQLIGGLRTLMGGEIPEYAELADQSERASITCWNMRLNSAQRRDRRALRRHRDEPNMNEVRLRHSSGGRTCRKMTCRAEVWPRDDLANESALGVGFWLCQTLQTVLY